MNVYMEYSDERLMSLLKSGDKQAYAAIYSKFWPLIYRFARKMLRDGQAAEDLTQEVFYKLWNKAGELEITRSLSTYLYTAARNKVLDNIAHGKIIEQYASSLSEYLEKSEATTDHLIRENQLKQLIESELAALPEHMRIIFELSRKENMSYKEIADQLNISEGAVRGQVTRALRQLRKRLGLIAYLYLLLNNF